MLAKSKRLTTKQFNDVMQKGRVTHSALFLLRALGGQADTRFSAVAPQKTIKTAAVRNRIRRLVYAGLSPLFPQMTKGTWAIIFAKKDISLLNPAEINKDCEELLTKAKIV